MSQRTKELSALLIAFAACYGAAAIGAIFSVQGVSEWYATLAKPRWTPPAWLFGPVWTVLYAMMAISVWTVWRLRDRHRIAAAVAAFAVQLALNAAWSPLFFGAHNPGAALADILLLLVALVVTIRLFAEKSVVAAWLLVPYILWVSFASVLNLAIWRLNS